MKLLFIDNSTQLQTVDDLERRPRGGMVSSLFILTDGLASRGHDVTVWATIDKPGSTKAGARWQGHEELGLDQLRRDPPYDFLVCNRGVHDGYGFIQAKHRILWTHDLPHNGFIPEPWTIRAYSATVFMSKYAERVWRCFYRDIGKSFTIPNGVDKTRFYPREKDRNYLIYASAPNRGLKRVPLIFDAIRSRTRQGLYMRAYSNLALMHPNEVAGEVNGDGWETSYKAIRESDVELHDPVPQAQLAEELGRAGLMLLPTDYPEICSNVVLQALASGTPVVTTGKLGSVSEWVRHGKNGALTEWLPVDYMVYHQEMVRNAVAIISDDKKHRKMMQAAANTKLWTWDEVIDAWEKMFRKLS